MNSYERYMGTIRNEPVDILPRVPILMQFAAEYIGSNYGKFASDYMVLVDSNEACARDFGMDQVSCISDPYRETHGFGSKIEFVENGVPRSTHPLSEDKDFTKLLKPDPLKSERMLDRVKAAGEFKKRFDKEYSILGWIEGPAAEAADLRDVVNFLMDLMEDEKYAYELMEFCVPTGIEFAKAQLDAGCDTIGVGDAIASQVSKDTYEKLILPNEKKLFSAIKDMGGLIKLHICGNITHLLDGISELPIDVIDVDHMVDMKTVRNKLGTSVAIAGNIDPAAGVLSGNPEHIKKVMLETYDAIGNPYMPMAGCEIPSGTPNENLKALCEPIPYKG